MAEQRPIWQGHLRLALVSCPVALYSAHHDRGSLQFNLINPATGHRVRMVATDAETGEEVSRADLVKGFEYEKDAHVTLDNNDFESARVEGSSTIRIDKFVESDAIDPIYFDRSYYLAVDDKSGGDVYKVLWEAIRERGVIALSRIVIARRERPIAIMILGDGFVVHTLNEERDLNRPEALFADMAAVKVDREMVTLAAELIDRQAGKYDPTDSEDRYETRLRQVIDAKLKGEGIAQVDEGARDEGNVIDLMAALKRSLGQNGPKKAKQISAKNPRAKPAKPKPKGSVAARV